MIAIEGVGLGLISIIVIYVIYILFLGLVRTVIEWFRQRKVKKQYGCKDAK